MPSINADRLLTTLDQLRQFGASGNGVVRPAFSDTDLEARRWLADRMRDAGLDPTIDGVGNLIGRSPNEGRAVLVGSHSDTQPEGGWLDGAMGVAHAIEVAHALSEDPATAHLAVDAVSWSDEEGTYASFLGSRSFVGEVDNDELRTAVAADGTRLEDARRSHGLLDQPIAHLEPGRYVAYLESHIEQGPVLDDADLRLGVVTSIVGIRTLEVVFTGQQNHAGTTPMDRRRDAMTAFVRWASELHDGMPDVAGPTSVWTIGSVEVDPGAQSIVPGRVTALLQFRDPEETTLEEIEAFVMRLAAEHDGDVAVDAHRHGASVSAQPMAEAMQAALRSAAATVAPESWQMMPSAAGHDAQVIAPHVPTGMLFIPSIDGVSHDFAEDSHNAFLPLGC